MFPNLLFVSHLFPFILYIGPVSKPIIVSSCKFMVLPLIKIQGFALCCVVVFFFPRAAVGVSDVGNAVVGYNWSLGCSLSASGLTVWPGEGA